MKNSDWKKDPRVFLALAKNYGEEFPYHPAEFYPEYPFGKKGSGENPPYQAIRNLFKIAKLDEKNFGKKTWNPLGEFVSPESKVFINFEAGPHPVHLSLLRPILDYLFIALKGKGRITVSLGSLYGEAPQPELVNSIKKLFSFYDSKHLDFRIFSVTEKIRKREQISREENGDPSGYTMVDLADSSEFSSYTGNWQFRSRRDSKAPLKDHRPGIHKYLLSSSAMKADVLINLVKLETHALSCLALTLMNCLNIVEDRGGLPFFSAGPPEKGGDEFPYGPENKTSLPFLKRILFTALNKIPLLEKAFRKISSRTVLGGSWWGNDTLWRTVIDLNKVLLYFNEEGQMRTKPLHLLNFVDGIISFQHSEEASDKNTGVVLFGQNPVAVDCAAARLVGVDWKRVPILKKAFEIKTFPLADFHPEDIEVISEDVFVRGKLDTIEPLIFFTLPAGWKDKAELKF